MRSQGYWPGDERDGKPGEKMDPPIDCNGIRSGPFAIVINFWIPVCCFLLKVGKHMFSLLDSPFAAKLEAFAFGAVRNVEGNTTNRRESQNKGQERLPTEVDTANPRDTKRKNRHVHGVISGSLEDESEREERRRDPLFEISVLLT